MIRRSIFQSYLTVLAHDYFCNRFLVPVVPFGNRVPFRHRTAVFDGIHKATIIESAIADSRYSLGDTDRSKSFATRKCIVADRLQGVGEVDAVQKRAVAEGIRPDVGQAVAKQRKAVGLTQAQLAERLNLSLDAISRLERGNIGLTVERLVELAEIFGCETADLLHESSTRVRDQARKLEDLLQELAEEERICLPQTIRRG